MNDRSTRTNRSPALGWSAGLLLFSLGVLLLAVFAATADDCRHRTTPVVAGVVAGILVTTAGAVAATLLLTRGRSVVTRIAIAVPVAAVVAYGSFLTIILSVLGRCGE